MRFSKSKCPLWLVLVFVPLLAFLATCFGVLTWYESLTAAAAILAALFGLFSLMHQIREPKFVLYFTEASEPNDEIVEVSINKDSVYIEPQGWSYRLY